MEHLFAMDAILEALIESLLVEYNLEIFIAMCILGIMALGIVLMALISAAALLVVPPVYCYMAFQFIKETFQKLRK